MLQHLGIVSRMNLIKLSGVFQCRKMWTITKIRSPMKNYFQQRLNSSVPKFRKSETLVGKWLLGCSGMVFIAVALGGVTRLTESGLSMVSWKFLGEKIPSTQSEWEKEFQEYQKFPEFKMKNNSMGLEDFKYIYMMEYAHRMWGRSIGACFLIPAAIFWRKGYFNSWTKKLVTILGVLLGAQGLLGWYMVKSGLENRFDDINDVPRVSQYRLASHLAMAFILYTLLLSAALAKLMPAKTVFIESANARSLRNIAVLSKGLIFLTAISGAFVAGLDAGLIYNSFPKMGDDWIPNDILKLEPILKNFTENPTTVQFDHRILGITTLCSVTLLWLLSKRFNLSKRMNWAINSVTLMAWIQASLGITTLLNHVPIPLATSHQSGSLLLISFAVWLSHEFRYLKYIRK